MSHAEALKRLIFPLRSVFYWRLPVANMCTATYQIIAVSIVMRGPLKLNAPPVNVTGPRRLSAPWRGRLRCLAADLICADTQSKGNVCTCVFGVQLLLLFSFPFLFSRCTFVIFGSSILVSFHGRFPVIQQQQQQHKSNCPLPIACGIDMVIYTNVYMMSIFQRWHGKVTFTLAK